MGVMGWVEWRGEAGWGGLEQRVEWGGTDGVVYYSASRYLIRLVDSPSQPRPGCVGRRLLPVTIY